jgi:hypothetical protein
LIEVLNEGCLEGVPDEDRVVFPISDENPEIWGDGRLEGTSSLLSLDPQSTIDLLGEIISNYHTSSG